MKHILAMAGVGTALFGGTIVGLLAAQGRLNYEGTRGVPLLSMLFSAPPEQPADPHAAPAGETAPAHGASAPAAHGEGEAHGEKSALGVQHEGLGKEERLPYAIGESAFGGGAPQGGHGDAAHGGADAHGEGHADEHAAAAGDEKSKLTPPETDFQKQMESLLGQKQYRRGEFFAFPRLEGDLTVEELNRFLRASKTALDDLDARKAKLEAETAELEARQRDVEDRERLVGEQMAKVDRERARLDKRITEFEAQVLLVKRDDLPKLKEYASTLASFDPKRATEHLMQMWESPEGQAYVIKVLAVMDREASDAILAEVELPKLKQILVQRLKVAIEEAAR